MGDNTAIEWTDRTDNIIVVKQGGWWCRKISPGCAHCYAARLNQSNYFKGNHLEYGGQPPELTLREDVIDGWARQTKPRRHFVASMTDVFGEWVPREWSVRFLRGMWRAPGQTFQVLTKRPEVALDHIKHWLALDGLTELPANIWIGTSVENQRCADERIPVLLLIPARVRFLSCEPLLGSVDLLAVPNLGNKVFWTKQGIHWVICGGESGPEARPMHPSWVRSLRDQCEAVKVPFFFKQWGEYAPSIFGSGQTPDHLPSSAGYYFEVPHPPGKVWRFGKKRAGKLLDGQLHEAFPA